MSEGIETIVIRKVELGDLHLLQRIGRKTFLETFGSTNDNADMEKYLAEGFTDNKLTSELSNADSFFYFATLGESVIGYLKLNKGQAQTEIKEDHGLEIERIYVLKEYHGKKVGQVLYDKAIEVANQLKVDYVWLGVWEENPRAISFYKKNGFVEFDKHVFKLGSDEQTDIMMRKELR
ncbi:N-acetyltransferase family protein [Mucilaginibacter sp. HD30]